MKMNSETVAVPGADAGDIAGMVRSGGVLAADNVSKLRHTQDGMYKGDDHHYMSCGRSALFNIALGLVSANAGTPLEILDFACGFGRVARHLRAGFPDARITFTDAMESATAFCAETFGGESLPIRKDFAGYSPARKFDLIWVGSLFTHLPEGKSAELIGLLLQNLSGGGVIVFTSHGRFVQERRNSGKWPYNIDAGQYDRMIQDKENSGYGFVGYGDSEAYGISLVSLGWWERTINSVAKSEVVLLRERGWDRHQDVIAIKKLA